MDLHLSELSNRFSNNCIKLMIEFFRYGELLILQIVIAGYVYILN